jgi:hypothetical protein
MKRRSFIRGLSTLTASSAGLALLDGCGQSFWDRRPAVAHVGILADAPHDSAVIQQQWR